MVQRHTQNAKINVITSRAVDILCSSLQYADAIGLAWSANATPVKQNLTVGFSLQYLFNTADRYQQGQVAG